MEALANVSFPDDIYALLQRVAELALKVVERFERIFQHCLQTTIKVDALAITKMIDRIDAYRNLIHGEFLAVHADPSGRMRWANHLPSFRLSSAASGTSGRLENW
jgi:hypothetical protein